MAVLTLAAFKKVWHGAGDRKVVIADLTDTGSYVVGGDLPASGTIAQLIGLDAELNDLEVTSAIATGGASMLAARYNEATGKIQLYTSNGAAPAAFAELTAIALPGGPYTLRVKGYGKGSIAPQ